MTGNNINGIIVSLRGTQSPNKKGEKIMKQNYFELGTIVAWSNDGEEASYSTITEAAESADVSEKDMEAALGTDTDFGGVTYFRYGIDEEATEGYDEARAEAEAIRADDED